MKTKLSPAERRLVGSFRDTEQVTLAWERTASIARALRARVVLFQCPASFRPEPENLHNLRRFFSQIDRAQFELAWEPRGHWSSDLVASISKDLNLIHCVDPFEAENSAGCAPYWRLHGRGSYSYRYSEADLEELGQLLAECLASSRGPRYIFFNNIAMKEDALTLQRQLAL